MMSVRVVPAVKVGMVMITGTVNRKSDEIVIISCVMV